MLLTIASSVRNPLSGRSVEGPAFSWYMAVVLRLWRRATLTMGEPHDADLGFLHCSSFTIHAQVSASKCKKLHMLPQKCTHYSWKCTHYSWKPRAEDISPWAQSHRLGMIWLLTIKPGVTRQECLDSDNNFPPETRCSFSDNWPQKGNLSPPDVL